jgi:hypothetical protein
MGTPGGVEYQPLIRELPAQERPRERLKKYGAASLSNAELLAIIQNCWRGSAVSADWRRLVSVSFVWSEAWQRPRQPN